MADSNGGVVRFSIRIPAASWSKLHLYLPFGIRRLCKDKIPTLVYFHVANGDIFEVNYNAHCACFVGLTKLFERYKLGSSDFLFFEYGGGSRFDVVIISCNTTEIFYPTDIMFHTADGMVVHSIPLVEPPVSGLGRELADDIRAALLLTNRHGSGIDQFKIIITESCLQPPGVVVIPSEFVFSGLESRDKCNVFVHFLERGWELEVQRCPAHVLFTTGWPVFALEAGLEVGDLCVFQRRQSRIGFTVGLYKDFRNTVVKQKKAQYGCRNFLKIVDDAIVQDGEIVTTGWPVFALEAGLEVGDLCVFQRRQSRIGFTVGLYKDFRNTVVKQKKAQYGCRNFLKIVDDAIVQDGEIYIPWVFAEADMHSIPPDIVLLTADKDVFPAKFNTKRSVIVGLKDLVLAEQLVVHDVLLLTYGGEGIFECKKFNSS